MTTTAATIAWRPERCFVWSRICTAWPYPAWAGASCSKFANPATNEDFGKRLRGSAWSDRRRIESTGDDSADQPGARFFPSDKRAGSSGSKSKLPRKSFPIQFSDRNQLRKSQSPMMLGLEISLAIRSRCRFWSPPDYGSNSGPSKEIRSKCNLSFCEINSRLIKVFFLRTCASSFRTRSLWQRLKESRGNLDEVGNSEAFDARRLMEFEFGDLGSMFGWKITTPMPTQVTTKM